MPTAAARQAKRPVRKKAIRTAGTKDKFEWIEQHPASGAPLDVLPVL
jgi:hypothetical protein